MTRLPNPKSKTPQLIFTARNEDERMLVQGMRTVFSREEPGMMTDEVFEAMRRILAQHHYPPGNPQTQMDRFGGELTLVCNRCGKGGFKTLTRIEYQTGFIGHACDECVRKDRQNRLIRKVLGTI